MSALWQTFLAQVLPLAPSWALWPVARQYVAGDSLDAMAAVVGALNAEGARCTVDLLSEDVTDAGQTRAIADQYAAALDRIAHEQLNSHIAIKLSALGLTQDADLCLNNARRLLTHAGRTGAFVRIDMEDATRTEATLSAYERLREEFDNVGVAIQAYLRRSLADVRRVSEGPAPGISGSARAFTANRAPSLFRTPKLSAAITCGS